MSHCSTAQQKYRLAYLKQGIPNESNSQSHPRHKNVNANFYNINFVFEMVQFEVVVSHFLCILNFKFWKNGSIVRQKTPQIVSMIEEPGIG